MIRSFLRAALAASVLLSTPVFAQEGHDGAAAPAVAVGNLQISGAFVRATLPNAPVGGGYVSITNSGTEPDRLVSVASPVSGNVQVHEMAMENDVMKMRALPDGLEIPAGQTVTLAPGGLHIMFMGISQPFVEGQSVPVMLSFEKAGTVEVEFAVAGTAAGAPGHGMNH